MALNNYKPNWIKIEPGCELPPLGKDILVTACWVGSQKIFPSMVLLQTQEELDQFAAGIHPYATNSMQAVAWAPAPILYGEEIADEIQM